MIVGYETLRRRQKRQWRRDRKRKEQRQYDSQGDRFDIFGEDGIECAECGPLADWSAEDAICFTDCTPDDDGRALESGSV